MKVSELKDHHHLVLKAEHWLEMMTDDIHPTIFDGVGVKVVHWWVQGALGKEGPDYASFDEPDMIAWGAGYAYHMGTCTAVLDTMEASSA